MKYDNIPVVTKHRDYKYQGVGRWFWWSNKKLLYIIQACNKTWKISDPCRLEGCSRQDKNHVVTIRFKREADRLQIEVVPTSWKDLQYLSGDHTHDDTHLYTDWYIAGDKGFRNLLFGRVKISDFDFMYPFSTATYTEIVNFVRNSDNTELNCLMSEK